MPLCSATIARGWVLGLTFWAWLVAGLPVPLVATAVMGWPVAAEARSGSSGGYSRPSFRAPRTPSASGGYTRPRTPGFGPSVPRTPSPSDQALSRRGSAEALGRYRSAQEAERSGGPPPGASRTPSSSPWYGNRGWSPPPYAYRSPPRFGLWDALFLWFLLDTLDKPGHAAFFHNRQDDPGYREWRAEADRQAQDDPSLRAKLDQLDGTLAARAGQPRDPNYLPPDAPPGAERGTGGGAGVWWVVVVLGGVLLVLWWRRRARPAGVTRGGAMSPLSTIGNFFRQKASRQAYRPSLFRIGMTITIDPAPFLLVGERVKVSPPPTDGAHLVSVEAVGTMEVDGVTLQRLYLPERGFFQLHLDAAGQPDECRYFSVIDEVTPADQEEWGFWLDPREGAIGWPEFQTKDGKTYSRVWSPGGSRIQPTRLAENIATASGTVSSLSQAMLYAAPTGADPPAPPYEYILVAAVEQRGQAWVRIAAGIDVNPASLSLA